MANDIKDPGPNGDYPHFPRDSAGFPVRHLDRVEGFAGVDQMGNAIRIDLTPRTPDGRPISAVAPRIPRRPRNGTAKREEWEAAGQRTETTEHTAPNGTTITIVRNIETGEQAEV